MVMVRESMTMVIIRMTAFLVMMAAIYLSWAGHCSKHFLSVISFRTKACLAGETGPVWREV